MRKLLILLLFPLLMGCSSDDHEDEIVDEGLIGSWFTTTLSGAPNPVDEDGYHIKTFMKDGRYYSHYWPKPYEKWELSTMSNTYDIKDNIVILNDTDGSYATLKFEIKNIKGEGLILYLYETYANVERLRGLYRKLSNKEIKDSGIHFD